MKSEALIENLRKQSVEDKKLMFDMKKKYEVDIQEFR